MELSRDKGIDWTEIVIPADKCIVYVTDEDQNRTDRPISKISVGFHLDHVTKARKIIAENKFIFLIQIHSCARTGSIELEHTFLIKETGVTIEIYDEPSDSRLFVYLDRDTFEQLISDSACDQALANVLG